MQRLQRLRTLRTSVWRSVGMPELKKRASNSWSAVKDTFYSTKDTFERHRVVFTVGTSIASVATACIGESLISVSKSLGEGMEEAVDIKVLASLGRDELKKICGDSFPEWISFPKFEQVKWLNKQLNKLWPYIADLIGHSLVVIAESETSKGIGVRFVPAEGTRDVNALSYPGSSEG